MDLWIELVKRVKEGVRDRERQREREGEREVNRGMRASIDAGRTCD